MPIDAPAPTPSSLATAPSIEDVADSPAKRRRGTRGGRGRKRPGANGATDLPAPEELEPGSIEAVVAHQAAVLEQFTREVGATLKTLQASIAEL